jgi:hypothetical protein
MVYLGHQNQRHEMNKSVLKLIREMNLSIFTEEELVDKEIIVLFPGNFQPMGQHQREEYQRLCRKFGKDNVIVVTDDKIDQQKHPFSFDEKVTIMKRHGVKNVEKALNPFYPTEIISKMDESNTVLIIAVSSKNISKLKPIKKLTRYNGSGKLTIRDIQNPYVYYVVTNDVDYDIPSIGKLNFKNIQKALGDRDAKLSELKSRFISIFGWFDAKIFNMVIHKMNTDRGDIVEKSNPLSLVTRTFWNKVYNEIK